MLTEEVKNMHYGLRNVRNVKRNKINEILLFD